MQVRLLQIKEICLYEQPHIITLNSCSSSTSEDDNSNWVLILEVHVYCIFSIFLVVLIPGNWKVVGLDGS